MALFIEQFPTEQYDAIAAGVIVPDIYGIAIDWFTNRTPLFSRLDHLPVGSPTFYITNDNYRPRSQVLTSGYTTGSSTTLVFADGTEFDIGDVLLVDSEYMLVTATATTSVATTITVTGAYAGSTGANHLTGAVAYLITNTRTGAEINAQAQSRTPAVVTQYCQTVMHSYSVGGSLATTQNYVSGLGTPLDRDRMLCMQHCLDDMESGIYRGVGVSYGAAYNSRAMQNGIFQLVKTNRTTAPTNAAAYKPSDFVRDVIQPCFDNGGNPSVLILSTDFLTGLETWGNPAVRLDAGANAFGVAINMFEVPFLNGLSMVPAPLLPKGTAIALTAGEVRFRLKRALYDKPRGSRGDAYEGDMIMEGAIELDNEPHHSCVTGITGFASS